MTRIAFAGRGSVGSLLAEGLTTAGHDVSFDSYEDAEVVVNAVPGHVSVSLLSSLGLRPGTVLVDVANAVHTDESGFATELFYPGTSLAEELATALPDVRVVKTLNTMHVSLMANPTVPVTAFLSGDDEEAKSTVRGLLADLGWPTSAVLDLGGLQTARWAEAYILTVRPTIQSLGPVPFGLAVAYQHNHQPALQAEVQQLRREVGQTAAAARIQADPGPVDNSPTFSRSQLAEKWDLNP